MGMRKGRFLPDTQLSAYDAIRGTLPARRLAVLEVLEAVPAGLPLFEIAKRLGRPVHCVSGRLTELADARIIEDSGSIAVNPESGKAATVWRVRRAADPQMQLFEARAAQNFLSAPMTNETNCDRR